MTVLNLVDTHAHMCDAAFDPDRAQVLETARTAGVTAIIAVGEDLADARRNLRLSERYPMLKAAAGLYPAQVDPEQADGLVAFIRAERSRLWAIGEVGLDYWVVKTPEQRAVQRDIFARFIDLSLELDLPLNVHSRSAGRHVVDLLLEKGARQVQLHAFDGKAGKAQPAVAAGYYFSIPPSVVRSKQKQKLVRQLPLSCLLVETDSPVLGPEPGARNEPANLMTAISAIAELKQETESAVIEAVRENTARLYGDVLESEPVAFPG